MVMCMGAVPNYAKYSSCRQAGAAARGKIQNPKSKILKVSESDSVYSKCSGKDLSLFKPFLSCSLD